jgi:pimeloyl-ACP methyl ester carboxylesterase
MTKTVICSHGFGVKADSRGMFPEIAAAFPDWEFKMFDYNEVRPNGDTVVSSLHAQAKKLQRVIDETESDEIVLLGHSQGCLVAGLVNLEKVSKVILLAPPVGTSMKHVIGVLAGRPSAVYNPDGVSKLPRADGTTTHLEKGYIESLGAVKPLELYQKIADTKPTIIIRATEDKILGITNVNEVHGATHIDIAADHNFTADSRSKLTAMLKVSLA